MTQQNGDKSFDLAVLIDSNDHYNTILCGPIRYELAPRYIHFTESKKYLTGDINAVRKSSHFIQEIDSETYINGYIKNSDDITDSYKNITKVRLFKFKNENIWINYLNAQEHTHADIMLIVSDKNHPIYVLHDVNINFVNQSIQFKSFNDYQRNDVQILSVYAKQFKNFLFDNKWKISITVNADKIFKNGVCYNFNDDESKNEFFNQSYDVALITSDKNQIELLLSGITYIYNENVITFKSVVPYKNGYYDKLRQCGKQIKSISLKINNYRLCDTQVAYTFDKEFVDNKCMLFNICDIDGWVEFISKETTSMYDFGVITNNNEYQTYFLNKTIVNWMDKVISFGALEKFTPKHHGLITKFGKLIKQINLKDFSIENLECNEINNMYFYKWELYKESENKQDMDGDEYNKKIGRSRKTMSEMPYKKGKSKKDKNKKDKNKRNGKTKSEIRVTRHKRKVNVKKEDKKKQKRKDSVIKPSTALKLKNNKSKQNKNNKGSEPVSNNNNNNINEEKEAGGVSGVVSNNEIWDLYVQKYGMAPTKIYHLQKFTKTNGNIKNLSYKEVRQLFNERAKRRV